MSRLIDKQMVRATQSGAVDRVHELLESGASINRLHKDGFTPLMHFGIAERLFRAGASLDPRYLRADICEFAERHHATWLFHFLKKRRRRTKRSSEAGHRALVASVAPLLFAFESHWPVTTHTSVSSLS